MNEKFIQLEIWDLLEEARTAPDIENQSVVQIVDKEILLETLSEIEKSEDTGWESILDIALP